MEALHRKARQPKLRLEKGDLLILDARGASHHTMNAILQKAATARVTVVLIHDDPIAPNQIRVRNARDQIRSR